MFENKEFVVHLPLPDESFGLHINVMFFGELAEHVGMNQVEWGFSNSLSIRQLMLQLTQVFTELASFPETIEYALNRNIVDDTAMINVGDEVAFFPSLFEPNFKL